VGSLGAPPLNLNLTQQRAFQLTGTPFLFLVEFDRFNDAACTQSSRVRYASPSVG